jgi:hypothetical protein
VLLKVLLLRHFPPMLGISYIVKQATGILLGHLSSFAHLCKLNLEEGDLPDKVLCIFLSSG